MLPFVGVCGGGPFLPLVVGGGGPLLPFVGAGSGPLLPCMGPLSSFVGTASWGGAGPYSPFVGWYWAVVIVHGVVLGCCRHLWPPFRGWWCCAMFAVRGVVLGCCPLCHCLLVGHIRWIGLGGLTVRCVENGQ